MMDELHLSTRLKRVQIKKNKNTSEANETHICMSEELKMKIS